MFGLAGLMVWYGLAWENALVLALAALAFGQGLLILALRQIRDTIRGPQPSLAASIMHAYGKPKAKSAGSTDG